MRKLTRFLCSLAMMFSISAYVVQATYASTLLINEIEVNNFLPSDLLYAADDIYSVQAASQFSIDYAPENETFQIIVLQQPYDENRAIAEAAFVEKLGITKAEACYLSVSIVAPAYVTDRPDAHKLLLCEPNKQADLNSDGVINTFDFAICLEELMADPALNRKLQCDLNINRRIDATDFSSLITHIKKQ